MKKTGYDRVVAEEGCSVADPKETSVLFYDGPVRYKRFEVSKALFDADVVVNLPKFKTHGLTYITGAVKNFFGFISGLNKSQWHVRAPTKEEFSSFLLDLYESLLKGFEKPKRFIHLMDAITGMEGEGPGVSGRPRSIRAILLGGDAVAVDCVAVHLVGLAARLARTVTLGEERGLGAGSLAKIEVKGEKLDGFFAGHYVPSSPGDHHPVSRWPMNTKSVKNLLIERPVPSADKCTLCYQCKTICPGGAIETSLNTKIPLYNYNRCIRCYCCMEVCPEAAIHLKRGKLQWVLDIMGR
jgi:Pyruvate/2-oxoacid:ferredoxin oxidoreductase delta subunit